MKDYINLHFEILLLVFIFVFSTIMLAAFPMREEMARWIENGVVITIIARSMGVGKSDTGSKSDTTKTGETDAK
jgi:hypothetical protein